VGDRAPVKFLHSALEIFPASHAKTDMVQANPVLIEQVAMNGAGRIGSLGNGQDDLVVR
jgi:hypothetical protein